MPKTFRLREQLTRSYDTLLGDLKTRDEDVLHRKHAGENDADFDGLEPEEDFKVPLQREQRKPLDLVKQKQAAKKHPFFAPGQSGVVTARRPPGVIDAGDVRTVSVCSFSPCDLHRL